MKNNYSIAKHREYLLSGKKAFFQFIVLVRYRDSEHKFLNQIKNIRSDIMLQCRYFPYMYDSHI